LEDALNQARYELAQLESQMLDQKLGAEAAIFQAHAELLDDPELRATIQAKLADGENEIQAWRSAVDEHAAAIAALQDPLLAARASDLRDVGRRVLVLLLGVKEQPNALPEHPVVVLARDLSPSDAATFDAKRVLGFAIVEGGPTSHIAVLARWAFRRLSARTKHCSTLRMKPSSS
jgi:multiphosphoryl transfer protein